jgi:histidyl-tRNA synthetase
MSLFDEMAKNSDASSVDNIDFLKEKLNGLLEESVAENLKEIFASVNAAKTADFNLAFDPTLVRGMGYYTGTIFEIEMSELNCSVAGGGRYDKMVGNFTGQNVPACGFSIGFERIVLLLMESDFKIPGSKEKKAYLVEKDMPADKLVKVLKKANEERGNGRQVVVLKMNKNKKFQKEQLNNEGYADIEEFFTDRM